MLRLNGLYYYQRIAKHFAQSFSGTICSATNVKPFGAISDFWQQSMIGWLFGSMDSKYHNTVLQNCLLPLLMHR